MISIARIRGILLEPRKEWPAIAAEPTTPAALYTGWVIPLAAIGPIASVIGLTAFGVRLPFVGRYVLPFGSILSSALLRYVGALVGVWILAYIIDRLAPNFGGQSDSLAALKVAAYSSTAAWLAGIFGLLPMIAWLGLLGLYGIYLCYLGLPVLMKSPAERAVGYTAVVVVVGIVIFVVIGAISSLLLRSFRYGP
jgi:hypothetical protein